jgi:hypothetical protein
VEQIFAPLFPTVNEDFGIRVGRKAMTREREALTKFTIVVKFPVEDHADVVRFIPNRLVTARQVDDAEATHGESGSGAAWIVREKPVFVGTAMKHAGGHGMDESISGRGGGSIGEAADAAHAAT